MRFRLFFEILKNRCHCCRCSFACPFWNCVGTRPRTIDDGVGVERFRGQKMDGRCAASQQTNVGRHEKFSIEMSTVVRRTIKRLRRFYGRTIVSIQSEESVHRVYGKHCSWYFSSSSLLQTCCIVFVTFISFLKHPNKSFLTQ